MPLLLSFFARPLVKYLGGALLIGLMVWFAVHKWNNYKDSLIEEGRLKGRAEITLEYKKIVASNDATNRRVEKKVDEALGDFSAGLDKELGKLRANERGVANDILIRINKDPSTFNNKVCDTPKDVMDARNAIRKMGPKAKNTGSVTEGAK
jgi:hypothetical protein